MPAVSKAAAFLTKVSVFSAALWASPALWTATVLAEPSLLDEEIQVDILHASLDELLEMSVTSVSKTPVKVVDTAAAVSVITGDEIRRSGATSIPEALRLVPGVEVARMNSDKWAVSIRGFNARAANKLLVMIDGRTIYDPLFSGTLWETKDVMLEDVDRIEVIRGPGGSTWGANAVNGVINIITKSARETQGGLVTAGGGTEERGFSSMRYGGKLSDAAAYRVWGQYHNRDEGYLPEGSHDNSWHGDGGFRVDGEAGPNSSYSLIGNIYGGKSDGTSLVGDVDGKGQSLVAKWQERFSQSSHLNLQAFYDHTFIDASIFDERRHTAEFDLSHVVSVEEWLRVIYGGTYRYTTDKIDGTEFTWLDPRRRTVSQSGIFAKGLLTLLPETLDAEIGAKLEHNDYTGFEVQPEASLLWHAAENQTLWGRISRAVRTPSRLESDFRFAFPADGPLLFQGNPDLDAETLVAYEIGYRAIPRSDLSIEVTAYFNDYDRLITYEGPTHGNEGEGYTYGAEVSASWAPAGWWRIKALYSYLHMDLELDPESIADPAVAIDATEGNNPRNQASLRSSFDISNDWELDIGVRYVDALSSPHVSSYIATDVRLAWQALKALEIAVVGQNLFDRRHFEHAMPDVSAVERGVYGKLTWTF